MSKIQSPGYRYVRADSESELEKKVNSLLLEGWQIKGITTRYNFHGTQIFNVMMVIGAAMHPTSTK